MLLRWTELLSYCFLPGSSIMGSLLCLFHFAEGMGRQREITEGEREGCLVCAVLWIGWITAPGAHEPWLRSNWEQAGCCAACLLGGTAHTFLPARAGRAAQVASCDVNSWGMETVAARGMQGPGGNAAACMKWM